MNRDKVEEAVFSVLITALNAKEVTYNTPLGTLTKSINDFLYYVEEALCIPDCTFKTNHFRPEMRVHEAIGEMVAQLKDRG